MLQGYSTHCFLVHFFSRSRMILPGGKVGMVSCFFNFCLKLCACPCCALSFQTLAYFLAIVMPCSASWGASGSSASFSTGEGVSLNGALRTDSPIHRHLTQLGRRTWYYTYHDRNTRNARNWQYIAIQTQVSSCMQSHSGVHITVVCYSSGLGTSAVYSAYIHNGKHVSHLYTCIGIMHFVRMSVYIYIYVWMLLYMDIRYNMY